MEADQYSSALGAHEEDDEEAFVRGMTGQHHGAPDNGANSYAHTDFGQNIDPTLNGHAHAPQNPHHAQSAQLHHQQQRQQHPQHAQHHQDPTAHYADAQMQRHLYGPPGGGYAMHTPSENLSEASPGQFTSVSPAPQHGTQRLAPAFTPQDRSLPSKDVTDETIDDAYVAFILYCNPSVPLDTDTTELRKVFRQPPKSDGKTFNVFHLMELIEKFERKDIKTWTKLAIELGVERTAESSAQKVQQYAVRLKRWMHAMHVDAFFEYMLNKPHSYYQQIPPIGEERRERVRDGVPIEEDLALRALHPETRPKRGRRKTDDREENSSEKDQPPSKRQHLDTGTPADMDHFVYPDSAVSSSAGGMERYLVEEAVTHDHWAAATQSVLSAAPASASTPTGGQHFRWRAFSKVETATTPQTAHPSSNLLISQTPTTPHPDDIPTPTTATTPSSARPPRRRRHGPAVSSAWPGSSNPLTGKLRGRPPQNRSTRDGPFSTFPANPSPKTSTLDTVTATPTPTPIISHPPTRTFHTNPNNNGGGGGGFRQGPPNLHLQVPQQQHRPITMTSPAPTSAIEQHNTNGLTHVTDWHAHSPHPASAPSLHPHHSPAASTMLGKRAMSQIPRSTQLPSMDQMEQTLVVALMDVSLQQQHHARLSRPSVPSGFKESHMMARKVFEKLSATPGSEEKIAVLTGCYTSPSSGINNTEDEDSRVPFSGLTVERIRPEMATTLEALGLGGPDDDDYDDDAQADDDDDDANAEEDDNDESGESRSNRNVMVNNGGPTAGHRNRRRKKERRYRLSWDTGVGILKAKVSCEIALPVSPLRPQQGQQQQQQFGSGMDGVLDPIFGGTGNDGAGGNEDVDALKKKIKLLEQQLRGKTNEARKIREGVLRVIVESSSS